MDLVILFFVALCRLLSYIKRHKKVLISSVIPIIPVYGKKIMDKVTVQMILVNMIE